MQVNALDHIVLNVADVEASLEFYAGKLAMPAERVERWRKGEVGFPSVRVNDHTIIDLLAKKPDGNNLAHFCLVTDGRGDAILDELQSKGIDIERGPGLRSGARGDGTSVYVRDPDGNQVEIRWYE
jgi:catechol 2,3-dioxygenase-like lactoylglutathione lyase family enzyme